MRGMHLYRNKLTRFHFHLSLKYAGKTGISASDAPHKTPLNG